MSKTTHPANSAQSKAIKSFSSEFAHFCFAVVIITTIMFGTATLVAHFTSVDLSEKNNAVTNAVLHAAEKIAPSETVTSKSTRYGTLESLILSIDGQVERCDIIFEEPLAYVTCGEQLGQMTINYKEK